MIVDTSALIALIQNEPAAEQVAAALAGTRNPVIGAPAEKLLAGPILRRVGTERVPRLSGDQRTRRLCHASYLRPRPRHSRAHLKRQRLNRVGSAPHELGNMAIASDWHAPTITASLCALRYRRARVLDPRPESPCAGTACAARCCSRTFKMSA
jgi:hypothetical protein